MLLVKQESEDWERKGKQCLGYMLKSCSKFVMWHSANFANESS